ncbi:hypothetical protein MBTS_05155 [Methylobacterium bullatum]|nr:hypothetical protein [Methylobacterium bullatum]
MMPEGVLQRAMSDFFASCFVRFLAQPTAEDGIDTAGMSYVHIPEESYAKIVAARHRSVRGAVGIASHRGNPCPS